MTAHEKLAEWKRLSEKATCGPWEFTKADDIDDWMIYNSQFTFVKQDDSGVPVSDDDGAFIAESRTAVPKLIAALEIALEALDFYAKHDSVIKDAYHTGKTEKQICVVHTFINHQAKEAEKKIEEVLCEV
jgi:hypothetical protein